MYISRIFSLLLLLVSATESFALVFSYPKESPIYGDFRKRIHFGDVEIIYAQGQIQKGDTKKLERFLASHNLSHAVISFSSNGGNLYASLRLGRKIRELNLDTTIGTFKDGHYEKNEGECLSACVYAYAGGVNRYLTSEKPQLGVHQFYFQESVESSIEPEEALSDAQVVASGLVYHLTKMGVDPNLFSITAQANKDGMLYLNADQASKFKLVNNGIGLTKSQIKMVKDRAYLTVEREQSGLKGKIVLVCWPEEKVMETYLITNPADSKKKREWMTGFWLSIDNKDVYSKTGVTKDDKDVRQMKSAVIFRQPLTAELYDQLLAGNEFKALIGNDGLLGIYTTIDLTSARSQLKMYRESCSF